MAAGTALALVFVTGFGALSAPGPGLLRPRAALAASDGFTFAHVTDAHVGSSSGNANLPKVVEQLLSTDPRPAFIIDGGDMTEFGLPHQYDAYQQATRPLLDAGIFIYHTPGNHDARWSDAGKMGFTSRFGQPYSSFDRGGVHFVLLDSSINAETHGHLEKAMLDWLASDLAKVGTQTPVMVFSHHPVGYTASRFLDNDQDFLDLARPYNIVALFSGHGHTNLQWSVNGIPAFMTAAAMDGGFKLIRVENGEAKVYNQAAGAEPQLVATISLARPSVRPLFRITSPLKGAVVNGPTNPKLTVRYEATGFDQPPAKVQARLDLGAWQDVMAPAGAAASAGFGAALAGSATIDLTGLPPGFHNLYVQAFDAAGNRFVDRVQFRLTGYVAPAPQRGQSGAGVAAGGAAAPSAGSATVSPSNGPLFNTVPGLRWRFQTGGGIQGQPVVSGSLVYAGSSDGRLYAVRIDNGTQAWVFATGGAIVSGPTLDGGRVYFGSANGKVYALDAATGRLVWSRATSGAVVAAPLVHGGTVYIGSTDHNLYALDAATGAERWHFTAGDAIRTRPAFGRGAVYFGAWDRNVYAVDAATGQLRWSQTIARDIYYSSANGSPAYGFGRLFLTTPNDSKTGSAGLWALDPADGHTLWQSTESTGFSSPQLRAGSVVAGTLDGTAITLDPLTGRVQGRAASGWSTYDSTPVDFGQGGDAVYGTLGGRLVATNPDTGKTLWTYALGDNLIFSTPAVGPAGSAAGSGGSGPSSGASAGAGSEAARTVYIGSMDGYLYAVTATPSPALPQVTFKDLPGNWAKADVEAIAAAHMSNGLPDGSFGVDLPLRRGELVAMVARYLALTQPSPDFHSSFSDLADHWARPYIEALEEKGLLAGLVDKAAQGAAAPLVLVPFRPQDPITRGEAVQLIAAALRLKAPRPAFHSKLTDLGSYPGRDAVEALEQAGLVTGYLAGGKMVYNPAGSLTRAQGAALVARMLRY